MNATRRYVCMLDSLVSELGGEDVGGGGGGGVGVVIFSYSFLVNDL